jgi:GNAT superfamily N-acetyltransferase
MSTSETEGQRASGLTMSYTISGEDNGLDYSQLRQLFKEVSNYTFIEVPVSEKAHISFGTFKNDAVVKGQTKRWNYDPLFFKQKTAIKNTLGEHHQLINKSELYDTIKKLIPNGTKYLPKFYNAKEIEHGFNNNTIKFPLIVKKDNVPQQQAIRIVFTKEEYYKAIKDLGMKIDKHSFNNKSDGYTNKSDGYTNKSDGYTNKSNGYTNKSDDYTNKSDGYTNKSDGYTNKSNGYTNKSDDYTNKSDGYAMPAMPAMPAMASEYITNPLLIDGKKFHLRILFLLSVISGITRCSVFPIYRVRTAELPYINSDYLNDKIHLTGGHHTTQLYNFPDDFKKHGYDIDTIENNLNACNKTIAMAITMANVKNYPESYAGYHLYGADIMITDDYHPYLLEINSKPGYTRMGDSEKGYDVKYVKFFSYKLFSFILQSTVFPTLGISRPPIYDAEFIGDGNLTPYANILTGNNKYFLIPYLNATQAELHMAEQIHFFHKNAMFHSMIKDCNPNNIFLISYSSFFLKRKETKKNVSNDKRVADVYGNDNDKRVADVYGNDNDKRVADVYGNDNDNDIIGYIIINSDNIICVAIAKEYQNRGIGTAMVAQLLEICRFRFATIPAISTNNIFMNKINDKILNINKLIHHNNHNLLTYQINNDEINSIFNLNKYMKQSNSQFVSFLYYLVVDAVIKKNSTGSKYNSDFIYQGAELKSTLNAPFLFNIYQFKKSLHSNTDYLDKKADIIDINKTYTVYNYKNNKIHILKHGLTVIEESTDELTEELTEEYYPPYLIDEKLMCLRVYLVIYISRNEIIQFYLFPKNIIITAQNKYNIHNLNELSVSLPGPTHTSKIYQYPKDLPTYETIKTFLEKICIDISNLNIMPYAESNSGFLECNIDIKFIKKHDEYIPIMHKIFNYNGIYKKQNNILSDEFIDEYYQWLKKCIILPHFGLSHKDNIKPIYGKIISTPSKKIQYSIIEKMHLEFNHARTEANIIIDSNIINTILLILQQNEIIIKSISIIDINTIYILMVKLSAYYAPLLVSLIIPHNIIIKNKKEIDDIAFELKFAKKSDYYIKKC